MNTLPAELITVIMMFCRQDCVIMSEVCQLYQKLYQQLVANIKSGHITPDLWLGILDSSSYDISKFKEPIDTFLSPNQLKTDRSSWDVNNTSKITEADQTWFKKIMMSRLDELYYVMAAEEDGDTWLVIGRTSGYYVCFMASCSYTVYWPTDEVRYVTGGTFAYCTEWKRLWNMNLTEDARNDMLELTDYIKPELWDFLNGREKLETAEMDMELNKSGSW